MPVPVQILPPSRPASWYNPLSDFLDTIQQKQQIAQAQAQQQQMLSEYGQGPVALQKLLTMPVEQQQPFVQGLPQGTKKYVAENYPKFASEQMKTQADQQQATAEAKARAIQERVKAIAGLSDRGQMIAAYNQQPPEIKAAFPFDPTQLPPEAPDQSSELATKRYGLERERFDWEKQQAADKAKNAAPQDITGPEDKRFKIAQDLAYGKLTFKDFRTLYAYSRQTGDKVAIYTKASELNPNFDPAKFELGFTVAANPKIRQQVAAQDNALSLIPEMVDYSDKATRLGPTAMNALINKGGIALGGKKYTNLATMQTVFADEVSGALGFGSATDMTRQLGLHMADLNLSSPNFRSAMQIIAEAMQKKRASLVNQMGVYGSKVNEMSNQNAPRGTLPPGAIEMPDGTAWITNPDGTRTRVR